MQEVGYYAAWRRINVCSQGVVLLLQAIEAAIELNLDTVEAGAQGEHKVQRGYMPVPTYSCHYIADEGFRKVIEDFLVRETTQVLNFSHKICTEIQCGETFPHFSP